MSLNSVHVVEIDGRGRDQFYSISHVSRTKDQSSKFGNALRCVFIGMWILFVEHQWHFTTLFPQLFFCLGVRISLGKIKTELNLDS